MTTTRLGRKIGNVIARNGINQIQFAQAARLSNAAMVKIRAKGSRPSPQTLRAVCNCSAISRDDGAEILCEHLRDEIERAGFLQEEIAIGSGRPAPHRPTDVDRVMDVLREAAEREDVRLLLHDLAIVVRSLQRSDAPQQLKVAEGHGAYHAPKRDKGR